MAMTTKKISVNFHIEGLDEFTGAAEDVKTSLDEFIKAALTLNINMDKLNNTRIKLVND